MTSTEVSQELKDYDFVFNIPNPKAPGTTPEPTTTPDEQKRKQLMIAGTVLAVVIIAVLWFSNRGGKNIA